MQTEKVVLEDEVVQQILAGRRVAAIKALRNIRGIGLKESKQLVELYAMQNDITVKDSSSSSISGYVIFALFAVGLYFLLTN
ncbi:MAG: hypothetical protein GY787_13480 [Alteromonadales bacterium]|nr:hypothetical protein [Alteromonadales bacterium]